MSILFSAASALLVAGAARAASGFQRTGRYRASWWLLAAVAIPSSLQFPYPALYDLWVRDPAAVLHGQWWRLFSANLVQDGGLPGTLFNLAFLAVTAPQAERAWGARGTLALFCAFGIVFNVVGVLQDRAGAGNSGATFALAASVGALALARRTPGYPWALLCPLSGVVMLAIGDYHWTAVAAGTLGGALLSLCSRSRIAEPPAAGQPRS